MKLVKIGDLSRIEPYSQTKFMLTYNKPYEKVEIVDSPIRVKLDTDLIALVGNVNGQTVFDFLYSTQRKFKLEFLLDYVRQIPFFRDSMFVKDFSR